MKNAVCTAADLNCTPILNQPLPGAASILDFLMDHFQSQSLARAFQFSILFGDEIDIITRMLCQGYRSQLRFFGQPAGSILLDCS